MEKISVYGLGKFYDDYKEEIEKEFEITQYFDKNNVWGGGMQSLSILEKDTNRIIIMISNVQYVIEVIETLKQCGVKHSRIILGISKWGEFSKADEICVDKEYKVHLINNGIDLIVNSKDEFLNAFESIVFECYKYNLVASKKQVVIDVGMNIADSAVYFAKQANVLMVYAFEPFESTFCCAMENIERNGVRNEIEAYQYGLSGEEKISQIPFRKEMTCGQSTDEFFNNKAKMSYEKWGLIDNSSVYYETVEVKESSSVLSEIINGYDDCDFVLKIDCEGEEYNIIENLSESGIIEKISLIMMEWHYNGSDSLVEQLNKHGFSYIASQKSFIPELGVIYAWK